MHSRTHAQVPHQGAVFTLPINSLAHEAPHAQLSASKSFVLWFEYGGTRHPGPDRKVNKKEQGDNKGGKRIQRKSKINCTIAFKPTGI